MSQTSRRVQPRGFKDSDRYKETIRALGRRIRELRDELGLTLEQANERTKVDWKHLQKIEAGKINLTVATLVRVADGFGVALADLFDEGPAGGISKPKAPEKK